MKLRIKSLDIDNATQKNSEQIWGEVYIELGALCFPCEDWYDIASSILDMWLPSILDFVHGRTKKGELFFMDGPYKVCLNRISKDRIGISLLQLNQMVVTHECALIEFLDAIIDGTDTFLDLCKEGNTIFVSSRIYSRIVADGNELREIAADITRK